MGRPHHGRTRLPLQGGLRSSESGLSFLFLSASVSLPPLTPGHACAITLSRAPKAASLRSYPALQRTTTKHLPMLMHVRPCVTPCVHMSPPNLASFLTCGPVSSALVQPHRVVADRQTRRQFGTRLRASRTEYLASSVYSPFALLIRGSFAASSPMQAMQAMQRNRIAFAFAFAPPIIAYCTGFWTSLRFSCFSASACPPVKRIAVLFRSSFGSFRRENVSLFRDTRQSLACRTHAPSQHPTNTHVPDLSGRLSSSPPVFQSVATHACPSSIPFGPTPPTFHTLTPPLPPLPRFPHLRP